MGLFERRRSQAGALVAPEQRAFAVAALSGRAFEFMWEAGKIPPPHWTWPNAFLAGDPSLWADEVREAWQDRGSSTDLDQRSVDATRELLRHQEAVGANVGEILAAHNSVTVTLALGTLALAAGILRRHPSAFERWVEEVEHGISDHRALVASPPPTELTPPSGERIADFVAGAVDRADTLSAEGTGGSDVSLANLPAFPGTDDSWGPGFAPQVVEIAELLRLEVNGMQAGLAMAASTSRVIERTWQALVGAASEFEDEIVSFGTGDEAAAMATLAQGRERYTELAEAGEIEIGDTRFEQLMPRLLHHPVVEQAERLATSAEGRAAALEMAGPGLDALFQRKTAALLRGLQDRYPDLVSDERHAHDTGSALYTLMLEGWAVGRCVLDHEAKSDAAFEATDARSLDSEALMVFDRLDLDDFSDLGFYIVSDLSGMHVALLLGVDPGENEGERAAWTLGETALQYGVAVACAQTGVSRL